MDSRILAAVARGGGLVTAARLHEIGVSSRQLTSLVSAGELVAVRRGVYTTAALWDQMDDYVERPLARIRAADLTLRIPHVYSHDSSAVVQRVPLLRPQDAAVHVTRTDMRGTRTKAGIRHHGARYSEERVRRVRGLDVLDIPRTVVDIAREHGYRAGLVAADGAMQLGTSRRELAAAAHELQGTPYSLTVDAVVAAGDRGAESAGETLMRELVEESGLAPDETQFPISISSGVVWVDLRVGCHLFEFDGKVKVLPPQAGGVAENAATKVLWDERKRQHLVCAEGLGMSRLTWDDFWGDARERAKRRILAEHAVTVDRFGTQLPPHLAEFAARMRGRRYKSAG
jgi:hypothetical protein